MNKRTVFGEMELDLVKNEQLKSFQTTVVGGIIFLDCVTEIAFD